jgi:uncharacterized protein
VGDYLYQLRPARPAMLREGPTAEEEKILDAHVAYLADLTGKGVVILAGRTQNTDPSSFGIVIFTADSEEAAREIMNEDPGVKRGMMRAELFPYRIAFHREPRRSE